MTKILCVIPARSGSKGLPHKNIKPFCGKPLIAWNIEQALASKYPMRVIVSTDSEQYAAIAKAAGAEVPFLRPAAISQDMSTDHELFLHALAWLRDNEGYEPELVLQLRPTYPTRTVAQIDDCIDKFLAVKDHYDSLRTVIPTPKSPFKMYTMAWREFGLVDLRPLVHSLPGLPEPHNSCRQSLPPTYMHNGNIDIIKPEVIWSGSMSGERILPVVYDAGDNFDIDTEEDWNKAEVAASAATKAAAAAKAATSAEECQ